MNATLKRAMMNSVATDGTGRFIGRAGKGPPLARYIGGVWLPLSDKYMLAAMYGSQHKLVDGRLTYQYSHLVRALREVPASRNRIAVDVGAHVGLWSMHLTKVFSAVVAFEPVRDLAAIYPYNVNMDVAVLHQVGLSDHEGTARIHRSLENTGHNIILPHGELIHTKPLDAYGLPHCDFIKIDVEGHELAVLKGAERTLKRFRPIICMEHNGLETQNGGRRGEAVDYLLSLGAKFECSVGADVVFRWA